LLLGEDFGVEQAAEWGLVSRIVSDEELDLVAQDLATRLATKSRHAMAATKALIAQAPVSSFESQLLSEMSHFLRCAETSDFRKRVQAFLGK
jgi:enoyl-CoA hydratase/carnithine racemase